MSTTNNFNDRNYVITRQLFRHTATANASNDYPVFDTRELRSSVATLSVGRRWAGGRGGAVRWSLPMVIISAVRSYGHLWYGQIPNKMSDVDLWQNF